MGSWYETPGGVAAFWAPSSKALEIADGDISYRLATNAMVDVNGISRLHFELTDSLFNPEFPWGVLSADWDVNDRFDASCVYTFTNADANFATTNGRRLTMTMFVAEASEFAPGVIPTPQQVLDLGDSKLFIHRASASTQDAGDWIFPITGPRINAGSVPGFLKPNTKYWIVVMATHVNNMGSVPTIARDTPLEIAKARGISMWTNRTPLAPVITSPPDGAELAAGTATALSFVSTDADRVVGKMTPGYLDLAGVQVQRRDAPTTDDPDPEWGDIRTLGISGVLNPEGTGYEPVPVDDLDIEVSWEIFGATQSGTIAAFFKQARTLGLEAATRESAGASFWLPPGSHQIRVRTFDWAHPYPNYMLAFAMDPAGPFPAVMTPDIAPPQNTSPWSTPVDVTVGAQVPAPIPMSPINSVAVVKDQPVTLTWQYRNGYVPPFPQDAREVHIRKVGEAEWTTLVSGNSDQHSVLVSGYDLSEPGGYEWRVRVTDAAGVTSDWSTVARFWIVLAPESGPVRPVAPTSLDGATLGSGTHKVEVYRRGGKVRVGELSSLSHVDWNRVRDDISDAKVIVSDWGVDEGDLLSKLQTWAYELVIYRTTAFGSERVWEGPITLLTYESDKVTIQAKDVMAYAYRRIIKQAMNDSGSSLTAGQTVVQRAVRVLQQVFSTDDPNVLAYLTPIMFSDDAKQYRSLPPYARTAYEEIDDMAANSGLDYTCSGRAVLVWGTKHRIGTLPEFRDSDLGETPIVSEYGMSMSNVYAVSDGTGVWGVAAEGGISVSEDGEVSGNDETYGLVEMLSSTWASDSEEEAGTYTESGLETVRESFTEYADRSIEDRYPPPVVVRVPDNTTLNPGVVLSIQQLVPGVIVPLRSNATLRPVVATQKLDKVQVTETSGTETIAVTMSPFNRDDSEGGEDA